MSIVENVISVRLDDKNDALVILDQTLLPNEVTYLRLKTAEEIWQAIKRLQVRGAPAIGIAAAFGLYLCTKHIQADGYQDFRLELLCLWLESGRQMEN